ncbi:hypothetical protein [Aquimarina rhabdastrellae]
MGKSKILLACDEANHVCDKAQYKEATLWEKIRLNVHLIYCRACRKYTKNNLKLTKLMKSPEVKTIDQRDKQAMKERLMQELSNHQ